MSNTINTFNRYAVTMHKEHIVFLRPVPQQLTPQDAMLLAAYLVCFAEPEMGDFDKYLQAVREC